MAIDSSTARSGLSMVDDDEDEPSIEQPDVAEPEDDLTEENGDKPRRKGILKQLLAQIDDINLARYIDEQDLAEIGSTVVQEYRIDENSRSEWVTHSKEAMKFATQDAPPKQYPWPGAANVIYPLMSQAALSFAARTYPALVQNRNVVKGIVWGTDRGTPVTEDGRAGGKPKMGPPGPDGQPTPIWLIAPGEKRKRADRIGEHMSWQLLDDMPEWEPQTDQLLHQIPIVGGAARKTFYEPSEGRNFSLFVSLMNLVWNYHAPSFEAAQRITEKILLYPNEIREFELSGDEGAGGMFLPLDYGPAGGGGDGETFGFDEEVQSGSQDDPDAPHMYIEQHRRLDLDDDGYAEPYIVTVHLRSGKVVRIIARYDDDGITMSKNKREVIRITPVDYYTLIPFLPSLDGGSYPMGFGHLLRPMNEAINTTLNQMFDAGHLQNAGGGFIGDGLSIASGPVGFQVGKYVRVTTKGLSIRDSVFPIPFNGPSPVLFQLLGVLIGSAEKLASIQDILAGDAAMANAPPTTILALIEQGLKIYTAINKRIFRAFKAEFQKLYRLNRKYLTEPTRYRIGDEWREVTPEDYRLGGGVEPIADPTMMTDMQKLGQAQIIMAYKGDPMIKQDEIARRLFDAANVDRVDELFAPPDPQAQQMQQMAVQLGIQKAQAELGRERAAELKDQTQAFLNMALARKNADASQEAVIEQQLTFMRQNIEAINTTIKAAAIDHKFHDTAMKTAHANADRAVKVAQQHIDAAQAEAPVTPPIGPTPPPAGVFPVGPATGPDSGGGAGGPPVTTTGEAGASPPPGHSDTAGLAPLPPPAGEPGGTGGAR